MKPEIQLKLIEDIANVLTDKALPLDNQEEYFIEQFNYLMNCSENELLEYADFHNIQV